eukprot:9502787-Pyramimonas_sp.AAC.1
MPSARPTLLAAPAGAGAPVAGQPRRGLLEAVAGGPPRDEGAADEAEQLMKEAKTNVMLDSSVIATGQTIQTTIDSDPSLEFAKNLKEVSELKKATRTL